MTDARRALPSVSALLELGPVRELVARTDRSVVVRAVRDTVDAARSGAGPQPVSLDEWAERIEAAVSSAERPTLRRVINATGVVLHTNLGRAPLADCAIAAAHDVGGGFCNLEYDLQLGARGSRHDHCVQLLRELTGAEDALVVNNCAAALILALAELAGGREVVISRGELIEIGGSFRIPDIMRSAGVRLVEVGTTNRTNADDYRRAVGRDTGAVIKVHRSNFTMQGFVADVGVPELVAICAERDVPVIHDLGSGLLLDLSAFGLTGEPVAREAVAAGATLVLMSGDKLLGGPQAGILLGSASAVARLRRNPLTRALRPDKLTLAALSATLRLYLDPALALVRVPTLAMLTAPVEWLVQRARSVVETLAAAAIDASVVESVAEVGAGAFPAQRLRSAAVALPGDAADVERRLRGAELPVIARITRGETLLDLRSVPARDDDDLTAAVISAFR